MVSYNTITNEELINILKTYMDQRYWKLHDWDTILDTAEVNNNEVWFKLAFFTLGLDYDTLEYRDVININGFE
jgi:hypothetical protein